MRDSPNEFVIVYLVSCSLTDMPLKRNTLCNMTHRYDVHRYLEIEGMLGYKVDRMDLESSAVLALKGSVAEAKATAKRVGARVFDGGWVDWLAGRLMLRWMANVFKVYEVSNFETSLTYKLFNLI